MKLPKFLQFAAKTDISVEQKSEPKASVLTSIHEQSQFRIRADIKKWREALSQAEDKQYGDRQPLIQI